MKKCVFCSSPEIKDRLVIENSLAWAFPTNIPIVPGHILICPKRCISSVDDVSEKEWIAMMEIQKKLKIVFKDLFHATGYNFAWNEGAVAGQSVHHVHIHMIPRKEGDTGICEYEPRNFLYRPGSRVATPEAELLEVATLIKNALV